LLHHTGWFILKYSWYFRGSLRAIKEGLFYVNQIQGNCLCIIGCHTVLRVSFSSPFCRTLIGVFIPAAAAAAAVAAAAAAAAVAAAAAAAAVAAAAAAAAAVAAAAVPVFQSLTN
jgi:hypothetical protein